MSYEHYIQSIREMKPRNGNSFATTYYNATKEENKLLMEFVSAFINGMEADLLSDPNEAGYLYSTPLKGKHIKLTGQKYTIAEVLVDLYDQLKKGKNATKSMIDRWNSVFSGLGLEGNTIDIEYGIRSKARLPKHLFHIEGEE